MLKAYVRDLGNGWKAYKFSWARTCAEGGPSEFLYGVEQYRDFVKRGKKFYTRLDRKKDKGGENPLVGTTSGNNLLRPTRHCGWGRFRRQHKKKSGGLSNVKSPFWFVLVSRKIGKVL